MLGIAKPPKQEQIGSLRNSVSHPKDGSTSTAAQLLKSLVSQKPNSAPGVCAKLASVAVTRTIAAPSGISSPSSSLPMTTVYTLSGGGNAPSVISRTIQRKPVVNASTVSSQQMVATMTPAGVPSVKYHQGMLSHADLNPKVRLKRLTPKKKSPKNSPKRPTIISKKRKRLQVKEIDINELKKRRFESSIDESIRQSLKASIVRKSANTASYAKQMEVDPCSLSDKVRIAHVGNITTLRKKQNEIASRVLTESNKILLKKQQRKELLKNRARKDLGHSHPLIHPTKQSAFLPEAEQEEEVIDSPRLALMMEEEERKARENRKKDSPYLMFEITSDDGFKCQSESYEGKLLWSIISHKTRLIQ